MSDVPSDDQKPLPLEGMPRVSLVTPCYNGMPYLRAAIDSVLGQDYPEIEYLVMDGGSTDGTVELLKEYGNRLQWVSEPDAGQADAIARGFERTGGAILGWLNADDVLKPGAVRAAVAALQAHPRAGLVYGRADFIDAAGRSLGPCTVVEPYSRQRLLHYGDYIIQPAAFFTREAYTAAGELDRLLHWAMDWDLWLRLARDHEVLFLDRELASYRWLGSNKTAAGGFDRLAEVETVARRYGCSGLPAYFRLELARLLAARAGEDLKRRHFVPMLSKLAKCAAAIFASPRTTGCLFSPHVWRNYRSARALDRHVAS
jgi:glycosyltransferase involved in cell wall biosynthesis